MGQLDGGFTYSPDVSPLSLTEGMFREKHRKREILADPFIVMPAKVAPVQSRFAPRCARLRHASYSRAGPQQAQVRRGPAPAATRPRPLAHLKG